MRTEDAIGRWGGEEFLAVLRVTDEDGAIHVAERLRRAVADSAVGEPGRSVTIGVAQWRGEAPETLLAEADRALYAGKVAGRNLVSVSNRSSVVDQAAAERPVRNLVT